MLDTTSRQQPSWTLATEHELPELLELMRDFYEEDRLVFDAATAEKAARELFADKNRGTIFLLRKATGPVLGYLVATIGFSLEFGGRFVLLDELYLAPAARGQGAGKAALVHVETWAAAQGIGSVRLEVNHHNEKAYAVYMKAGFTDDRRHLLSKWVSRAAGL